MIAQAWSRFAKTLLRQEAVRHSSGKRKRRTDRHRAMREMESLEVRQLLTAFSWQGGFDGNTWNSARNWLNVDLGQTNQGIPGPNDTATIAGGPNLILTASTEVGALQFEDSAPHLQLHTMTFTLTMNGGRLEGGSLVGSYINNGTLVIDAPAAANTSTNGAPRLWGGLVNNGTLDVQRGTFVTSYYLSGVGHITNSAGATIQLADDTRLNAEWGQPFIVNSGVIRKAGGPGTASISSTIQSQSGSSIEVEEGTLRLGGFWQELSGPVDIAVGATLETYHAFAQNNEVRLTGDLTLTGGGEWLHSRGNVQLNGHTIQSTDSTMRINANAAELPHVARVLGYGTLDLPDFRLERGYLGQAGFGGSPLGHVITNDGLVTIAPAGSLEAFISGATLVNAGETVVDNVHAGGFNIEGGAINNNAGGTLTFLRDAYVQGAFANGVGPSFIRNSGLIVSDTTVASAVTFAGMILQTTPGSVFDVRGGALNLKELRHWSLEPGFQSHLTGSHFIVGAGATLDLMKPGGGANVAPRMSGTYTAEGAGQVLLGGVWWDDAEINFPDGMAVWGPSLFFGRVTNAGFLRTGTDTSSTRSVWGELRNLGTLTIEGGNALNLNQIFVGPGTLTNFRTGVVRVPNGGQILGNPGANVQLNQSPLIVNEGLIDIGTGGVNIQPRLDNFGTIETRGAATIHNPRSLLLDGADRFGLSGDWVARDGGLISFPSVNSRFESLNGRIALIGAGSTFTGLELSRIRGELSLTGGATMTLPANVTSDGHIEVGAGSQLTVNGSLTQSAFGRLTTRVGGVSQIGRVQTTGAVALAGTLITGLENGFEPLVTDRFDVLTSPAVSGQFDDVQEHGLAASVTPTTVTLGPEAAAGDLVIEGVQLIGASGPLQPGQTIQVQYTVRNLTPREVVGPWSDVISLSANPQLSADDRAVHRSAATLSLPEFGSVTLTETVTLPDRPGSWFVLVAADASGVVLDMNRRNNVASSTTPVQIAATHLPYAVDVPSDAPAGQPVHYQLQVPAGASSIRIRTTFPGNDAGEIRVRRGQLPDNSTEALVADSVVAGAQREATITLTEPAAGTWYVSVLSRTAGVAVTRADNLSSTLAITGLLNESGMSNQWIAGDSLSVTVLGSGFTAATQFRLGSWNADSVTVISPTQAVVTFGNLTAGGPLQISATDGGAPVVYAGKSFTVVAGSTSAAAAWAALPDWDIEINMPEITRPFREIPVIVTFRNRSSRSQPAPLIQLVTDNGAFRFDGSSNYSSEFATALGVKPTGRADNYAPGESGTLKLFVSPLLDGNHVFTNVSAAAVAEKDLLTVAGPGGEVRPQESPLSLPAAFIDGLRPDFISLDAWTQAVRPALVAMTGTTIESWSAAVRHAATVLAEDGVPTADPSRAIAYLVQLANRFGEIHERFELTAFGRGMENPFDLRAVEDVNGNVTIVAGFARRSFERQGSQYIGLTGDRGRLTTRTGGGWLLTEVDGRVSAFAADGRWEYVDDELGLRTVGGYSSGRLTTITDPFGDVTTLSYNADGRIEAVTDPVGRPTTFSYDAQQRLITITDTQGTTTLEWNADTTGSKAWTQSAFIAADGVRSEYEYDALGRLVREQYDSGVQAFDFAYGTGPALGQVTLTDSLGRVTTVSQSELGAATRVVDAIGGVTDPDFDRLGRLTSLTSGGQRSSIQRDAFGNPVRATSPGGHDLTFEYDAIAVNPEGLVDPLGRFTDFINEDRKLLTAQVDPSGRVELYGYDAAGNRVFRRSEGGHWVLDTVDAKNLVTGREFSDGSRIDYGYDIHRNVTTVTETPVSGAPRVVTITYDAADRATRITYPGGRFVDYRYDAFGRQDRITTSDGLTIDYTFDSLSRVVTVARNGSVQVTYDWDVLNRLSSKTFASGAVSAYSYDELNRITRIEHRDASAAVLAFQDYTYDDRDRVTSMTDAHGVTQYAYDTDGQLTQVTLPDGSVRNYAVDAVGNRTAYTVNELNQYLTGPDGELYQYDRDGNLLTVQKADGSAVAYGYDGRNRLVSIVEAGVTRQFEYDPLGNRSAMIVNGVRTDLLVDAIGGFDGLSDVLAEYNGATPLASYVIGEGLEAAFDGTGAGRYFHFDMTGNTAALTAGDSSVIASYRYLPFGELLSATGPAVAGNRFTFNGQWGVAQYGASSFDMRARLYDSATGRFTQQDPIGFGGRDVNLYRFATGNPVSFIDPGGLNWLKAAWNRIRRQVDPPSPKGGSAGGGGLPPKHNQRNSGGGGGRRRDDDGPAPDDDEIQRPGTKGEHTTFSDGLLDELAADAAQSVITVVVGPTAATVGGIMVLLTPTSDADEEFPPQHFYREKLIETQSKLHPLFDEKLRKKQMELDRELQFEELMEVLQCVRQRERELVTNERRTPGDPNEIIGPAGTGAAGFLNTPATFPYTIYFQNIPTAAAPAQEVFLTQTLDPNLDWETFELTGFGWGSVVQPVPAGLSSHRTHVTDPASGLVVEVSATFDAVNGQLSWTFRSLDPVTFDLPWDGLAGFLPPDDETGRGQGYVSYTIQPKANAADGTQFTAQAAIVFDTEAPLLTNTWLNTLDLVPPTSQVSALPARTLVPSFTVNWSGSDGSGSGIASYDVYVSTDGGPYELWQDDVAATSATFTGEHNRTYRFFSVATDRVGHEQAQPLAPQATTLVDLSRPSVTAPGSTTQEQRPAFSWTAVNNAVAYDVWIANDSTGQVPAIRTLVNGTTFTPSSDLGIGHYRISVRAQFSDGSFTAWGPTHGFVINTQLTGLQVLNPDSGLPSFQWQPVPGATKYDVWLDDVSTVPTPDVRQESMTASFTPAGGLPLGRHRLSVRAIDAAGHAAIWSPTIEFLVRTIPVIVSPAPATFDRTPTFSWNAIAGATRYELWVDNNTTGVSQFVHEPDLTTAGFTPALNLPDGDYTFWVRAFGPAGVIGRWSSGRKLHIGGRPTMLNPVGVVSDVTPQLTWTPVDGATLYDLWIDRTDVPQSQIVRRTDLTMPAFETPALPFGTYRVWVRALPAGGPAGPWSHPVAFSVAAINADRPTLTAPPAATLDSTPEIVWSAMPGAAQYVVTIQNASTSAIVLQTSGITTTSFSPPTDLPHGTYRVWVRAKIGNDFLGLSSDVRTFGIGTAPTLTVEVPPVAGLRFAWTPVDQAVRYHLRVDRLDVPETGVIDEPNLTGLEHVPTTSLPAGTWRAWIRAFSASGSATVWSSPVDFVIAAAGNDGGFNASDGFDEFTDAVFADYAEASV